MQVATRWNAVENRAEMAQKWWTPAFLKVRRNLLPAYESHLIVICLRSSFRLWRLGKRVYGKSSAARFVGHNIVAWFSSAVRSNAGKSHFAGTSSRTIARSDADPARPRRRARTLL